MCSRDYVDRGPTAAIPCDADRIAARQAGRREMPVRQPRSDDAQRHHSNGQDRLMWLAQGGSETLDSFASNLQIITGRAL